MSRDDSLHDGSRTYIPNTASSSVPVRVIHAAYERRLTDLNRRHLLTGGTSDIQQNDPREIIRQIEELAAAIRSTGENLSMSQAEALGAQVLALGLAVARVEDQTPHLGDTA